MGGFHGKTKQNWIKKLLKQLIPINEAYGIIGNFCFHNITKHIQPEGFSKLPNIECT